MLILEDIASFWDVISDPTLLAGYGGTRIPQINAAKGKYEVLLHLSTKTLYIPNPADTTEFLAVSLNLGALAYLSSIGTTQLDNLAVTTGKINDLAVTTGKIANDAVGLAQLAHGTAGKVIGFDGSGAPAELTNGGGGGSGTLGGCKVYRSGALSINNNTSTYISFDAEVYDTNTFHDNSTNPERITIPTTGIYLVGGQFSIQAPTSNTGYMEFDIIKNTSDGVISQRDGGANDLAVTKIATGITIASLTAGDYLRMLVRHQYGSSRSVNPGEAYTYMFAEQLR